MPVDEDQLLEFFDSYVETALWASTYEEVYEDEDGKERTRSVPMDRDFGPQHLAPLTRKSMMDDCRAFLAGVGHLLVDGSRREPNGSYSVLEYGAHDLWLTRNRHGAGFWAGGWNEDVEDVLTDTAHSFGEVDLYLSGGKIYSTIG